MAVAGDTLDTAPGIGAGNAPPTGAAGLAAFAQTPTGRNLMLSVALAIVVAIGAAAFLYAKTPDYRVLFSNFSDRDGGAIVATLQQLNIPYKYSDGGSAILVPADQVYDARLKLAQQGLPKGGSVGFELMENQKLGISQFLEQVNFQRALEGELARSIQSLAAVQSARVHLALPKSSVFVRDQQKPTASVLLNLNAGRSLDQQQVSAIVHLVASSVPELSPKNVTLVDQYGNLLSESDRNANSNSLDPTQLKYVQDLQASIVKRVESIITPIVGDNNVRAEATADVDFSHSEQAAEVYKPNQAPNTAAVRSEQTSESQNANGQSAGGVPGALSNQPPAPASAPITGTPAAGANAAGTPATGNTRKDSAVNYEVDKTIRYVQQPMGGLKRLSVAVVVNYKREIDKNGKVTYKALSDAEKTQITDLVKEAMGFNKDRGDTLNVVNSMFAGPEKDTSAEVPLWKRPEIIELAQQYAWKILAGLFILYLWFAFVKPILKKLMGPSAAEKAAQEAAEAEKTGAMDGEPGHEEMTEDEEDEAVEPMGLSTPGYQGDLEAAKELARTDPKVVANIIKGWVGGANE